MCGCVREREQLRCRVPARRHRRAIATGRDFDGHEIFGKIAGAVAIGGTSGVLEFAALDEVTRIWKCRARFAVYDARVPSAMIEMEVRIDDDIDFFGGERLGDKFVEQPRRAFEGIDVACVSRPIYRLLRFRPGSTSLPRE